ncbi:Fic family protein [Candidatus Nitrosotenuis cloacae]|uniref:Fic family protein n=1 Tax=Candidatus Nitrosotenuis cloacae TaxID=1603555 RepID=UPI00228307A2|nr:Fic family protein [Candidatus Nitrosotenuis cloacae]
MVSDNIVMKIHEQYLIETNRQILLRHKEKTGEPVYIGVIQKNMDEVLPMINDVGNSGNKKQDLLEITAYILGVITWKQPFMDGNRRTGIIAAGKFLRDNGYDLDIEPEGENLQLRSMLRRLKDQMLTLNQEAIRQLSFYISERVKEHEPRR